MMIQQEDEGVTNNGNVPSPADEAALQARLLDDLEGDADDGEAGLLNLYKLIVDISSGTLPQ